MPNWCVGTLKVRGEKENIKRFLLEVFEPITPSYVLAMGGKASVKTIDEDEWSLTINQDGSEGFHMKGTHRNFIDSSYIEWELDQERLILEDFKAAWCIEAEPLAIIAKEYDLDFKIYAYEKGMQFNVDIEIHKGVIIKNEQITFADYFWECNEPHRGG